MRHHHRIAGLLLAGASVIAVALPAALTAAAPAYASPAGFVQIQNDGTGLCLEPSPTSTVSPDPIIQDSCVSANQSEDWTAVSIGTNSWEFVNRATGDCLSAHTQHPAPGVKVVQWPCTNISDNRWSFTQPIPSPTTTTFVSEVGGTSFCADVPDSRLTQVFIEGCQAGLVLQQWDIVQDH
jgi:hypothetical protein